MQAFAMKGILCFMPTQHRQSISFLQLLASSRDCQNRRARGLQNAASGPGPELRGAARPVSESQRCSLQLDAWATHAVQRTEQRRRRHWEVAGPKSTASQSSRGHGVFAAGTFECCDHS